jgi:hypothetical protein
MVTTLHSDDPEMTTPNLRAKSSVFFLPTPQRTFYERVKLFINFSNQSHGQALFRLAYTALFLPLFTLTLLSQFSVPGQRCGPWAQSAGFMRDSYSHGLYLNGDNDSYWNFSLMCIPDVRLLTLRVSVSYAEWWSR